MNRLLLKGIFALKGNFDRGVVPPARIFDGVEITPFFGNALAAVTISADFELSWAFRGRAVQERTLRARRCRENVPRLVRMLETFDIPITWATVGHLFLDRCNRYGLDVPHREMPRPPENMRWDGDWYVHDPCTSLAQDPAWYAPDLIRGILASSTRHEIGSHSFSHIDFSPATSNRGLVRRELEECIKLMHSWGLSLRSLAYPFNNMGHNYLDLMADLGITAVRHRDPHVRLSYPERSPTGVFKLYESMNLRRAKYFEYPEKAVVFVEEAMDRHGAYHLWFHPSDPWDLFDSEFVQIIRHVAALRGRGQVWVATMGDLAAYCEARQQSQLRVERTAGRLRVNLLTDYDRIRYGDTELTLRLPSGALLNVPARTHELEVGV